ncbi:MAG: aromatic-ring-hydroxylating dioxygenase subunit beta [Betaproteobacteria bacterium]
MTHISSDPAREAIELVECEARLLDERRFDEWLSLFAEDSWYWMPASWGQNSPDDSLSLVFEDRRLLALRVRRLASPVIHVEQPSSRTHHHLSGLRAQSVSHDVFEVQSMQLIVMLRAAEKQLFSAHCQHQVVRGTQGLQIAAKTIRLIDCDSPHRGLAVPL